MILGSVGDEAIAFSGLPDFCYVGVGCRTGFLREAGLTGFCAAFSFLFILLSLDPNLPKTENGETRAGTRKDSLCE